MVSPSATVPSEQATESLLEVRQLEVTYDRVIKAVQGISLHVPDGAVVAVLGSNGAGKTTMLRAITGFLAGENVALTGGDISLGGRSIRGEAPHRIARRGVVLIPERDKVFTTLTVAENLRMVPVPKHAASRRLETLDFIYTVFPVLRERSHQVAGYLSGGERQMLAIAKALLLEPRVLLADEISMGIAPALVRRLMEVLEQINRERGTAILIVEQNTAAALRTADYAYIMETGRIVFDGEPERLRAHADVREFYLGLGDADDDVKSYANVKQYRRSRRWWG